VLGEKRFLEGGCRLLLTVLAFFFDLILAVEVVLISWLVCDWIEEKRSKPQIKPQRHLEHKTQADVSKEEANAKAEYLEWQKLTDEAHKHYGVFNLTTKGIDISEH
jgi:hypothetical protein